MSGMGFWSSCLLVVGAIQQLYYKSPVMSQLFGEGIEVLDQFLIIPHPIVASTRLPIF
jgi:hypothetical protein